MEGYGETKEAPGSHVHDRQAKHSMKGEVRRLAKKFGVDIGDGLCWGGGSWVPGGEYAKKLNVKNIGTETIKLTYVLPKTKFFSMGFPEPLKLSPGTSKLLQVLFRPIEFAEYDDAIVFSTPSGQTFRVPIVARLSKLSESSRLSTRVLKAHTSHIFSPQVCLFLPSSTLGYFKLIGL